MSLECYDKAMKAKLESVFPNVVFSSLSSALSESANVESISKTSDGDVREKKKQEQVVSVPLIAFDRINNPLNWEFRANDPVVRRGRFVIKDLEQNDYYREKSLPVNIQYQIDIISNKRVEVDGIWRELVMFLYTHSELAVEFEGNNSFSESFPIKIMDTDNTTDVEDFSNVGRIYRQTLNVEIPQALLFFHEGVGLVKEIPIRQIHLDEEENYNVQSNQH